MGIAITYALANLAVLGLFFYATYRMTKFLLLFEGYNFCLLCINQLNRAINHLLLYGRGDLLVKLVFIEIFNYQNVNVTPVPT